MKREKKKKKSKGRILRIFLIAVLIIALSLGISIYISYNVLTVSNFNLSSEKIDNPIRIVMIADLHDHVFGEDNSSLVKRIKEQNPDVICMVGDMLNGDSERDDVAVDLVKKLKNVAPVYYSMGNHELEYIEAGHDEEVLFSNLEKAGAVILNHNVEDVEINGNKIRFGGMYEFGFRTGMQSEEENDIAESYLNQYLATDRYMIMLAHRPGAFAGWNLAGEYGIDLVLSGHLHGGQVIVPFVGGLYSQLENFWPGIDYGYYDLAGADMVLTRGLGSDHKILPRVNNPPEICVIDISARK